MAPYDLKSYNRWRALAGHITEADVDRLRPAGGAVLCISAEADPAVLKPTTAAEEKLYRQLADGRAAAAASTQPSPSDATMVRLQPRTGIPQIEQVATTFPHWQYQGGTPTLWVSVYGSR